MKGIKNGLPGNLPLKKVVNRHKNDQEIKNGLPWNLPSN